PRGGAAGRGRGERVIKAAGTVTSVTLSDTRFPARRHWREPGHGAGKIAKGFAGSDGRHAGSVSAVFSFPRRRRKRRPLQLQDVLAPGRRRAALLTRRRGGAAGAIRLRRRVVLCRRLVGRRLGLIRLVRPVLLLRVFVLGRRREAL